MATKRPITDFKVLTLGCFGTLIDWESGIYDMLRPLREMLPESHPHRNNREELLKLFVKKEGFVQQSVPMTLYPDVLSLSYTLLAEELGLECRREDAKAFGDSVHKWPAFPDSQEALKRLQAHFKLVVLSNVDRTSFRRAMAAQLPDVSFDASYTAQEIGRYKPDPWNFQFLIEKCEMKLDVKKSDMLHTAQSFTHDLVPAHDAGLASCWIECGVKFPAVCGGGPDPGLYADCTSFAWRFKTLGDMADYVDSLSVQ